MNHAVRSAAASAVGALALAVSALAAEADKPPVQSAGPSSFSRERTEDVCTREPRSQWLPEAEMRLLAEFRGYKIATFKIANGSCYEIYGFKSGKSIVKIRFTEKPPATAWNKAAANEYGFYSNVNPNVDHPRWSQATERRIGEDGLFTKKRKTLMFNGYEAQVGQLYAGMDLKKFF